MLEHEITSCLMTYVFKSFIYFGDACFQINSFFFFFILNKSTKGQPLINNKNVNKPLKNYNNNKF